MTTLEMVKKMSHFRREQWLEMAVRYGLACTCRSGYCAHHDMDLQKLIVDKRARMAEAEKRAVRSEQGSGYELFLILVALAIVAFFLLSKCGVV